MGYTSVSKIADSPRMQRRVMAAVASEGISDVYGWWSTNAWAVASAPGWAEAWEAAELNDPGNDLGGRLDVITDGMILSVVQPLVAT